MVQLAEKIGIEVIGVGMCTDAVKRFYANWVSVYNMQNLSKVCINELNTLLQKGRRKYAA